MKNKFFTRGICVFAHLTQTRYAQKTCAEMRIFMSDYEKFMEELSAQVAEKMGEEYGTEVHQVTKANVGSTDALIVFRRNRTEETASPTFYFPPLFYEYREGRKLEDIAEDIKEVYYGQATEMEETVRNLGNIREYECCRHRIYFRLVNTEKNRAFLEDKVHFEVLDLSMVFYILVSEDNGRVGAVPIQKRLAEAWGIRAGELRKQAEENTPGLFPAKVQPLVSIMKGLLDEAETESIAGELRDALECRSGEPGHEEPFVMTNTSGLNGFSAVLYPETLKKFADSMGKNLYVLPSSQHEALLFPENTGITPKELQEMVAEVNASPAVADEDILSDSLYYYDREKNELRMAEGCKCAG